MVCLQQNIHGHAGRHKHIGQAAENLNACTPGPAEQSLCKTVGAVRKQKQQLGIQTFFRRF